MSGTVLVMGATGVFGSPVVRGLSERGYRVRALTRRAEVAHELFGVSVEIFEGNLERSRLDEAMEGCHAVHISLTPEVELTAMEHVLESSAAARLRRVSYVSGTSVREEHRWMPMIDIKVRAEEMLSSSGIPYTIFRPTWCMESLHRFVRGDRGLILVGNSPPPFHFVSASDFGRMVAAAYDDERTLGKRLVIHGPHGITLNDALDVYMEACHPDLKVTRLKLWQARLMAMLKPEIRSITRGIRYFDRVGEPGDPTEANELLGAPTTTFQSWITQQREASTVNA